MQEYLIQAQNLKILFFPFIGYLIFSAARHISIVVIYSDSTTMHSNTRGEANEIYPAFFFGVVMEDF